jgi:hypothetical protein
LSIADFRPPWGRFGAWLKSGEPRAAKGGRGFIALSAAVFRLEPQFGAFCRKARFFKARRRVVRRPAVNDRRDSLTQALIAAVKGRALI